MRWRRSRKNFLELIPVRNIQEFTQEGMKITLHIPRFSSAWMQKWLLRAGRSTHFRLHLDETGSSVWALIDGARNTGEICELLHGSLKDESDQHATAVRVTEFLRKLYKNRFITFKTENS
jgi:hypothetical protein